MAKKPSGIRGQITRLAQHSSIYAVSTALQKLPGLLLMPIYTSFSYIPSFDAFADYILVFTFIAFMNFFYAYGMDSALLRYFFLGNHDRKTVFSTTFFVLIPTSLVTTVLIFYFSGDLAGLMLNDAELGQLFQIAGLILFFDAFGNLPYHLLRAEEKSIQYTLFKGLRFTLELLFNVLYVVVLRLEVAGIFYTSLTVAIINLLVTLPVMMRYLQLKIDTSLWKEMISFGLPLLPHGIAFTTIEMIDRFIVPRFLGDEGLSLYGANYKFATVLLALITAFRNAWQPFFLKVAEQENARTMYARVLTYFSLGAGLIVIAGTFFVESILTYSFFGRSPLIQEPYWGGIPIIPIILLAYCFYGIYVILTPGFYITKKTHYMIIFTGSAAASNIAANYILLPAMQSIWGAAWATLISYFVMAFSIYLVSNRIYPIPIEWGRLAKIAALVAASMIFFYYQSPGFLVKLATLLAVALAGYRGVLNAAERSQVGKVLRILIARFKRS